MSPHSPTTHLSRLSIEAEPIIKKSGSRDPEQIGEKKEGEKKQSNLLAFITHFLIAILERTGVDDTFYKGHLSSGERLLIEFIIVIPWNKVVL